eukprot:gene7550-9283_t
MANPKGILIGGTLLTVVGIVLFIISFALFPIVLRNAADKAIKDGVIVDSESSSRYKDWLGQTSIDNYYQQYYYLWNMTNAQDVITNGSKPIYETVGPFNYKYEWQYLNSTFFDNGNQVSYSQLKTYTLDNDTTMINPYSTMITNINPAFLGVLGTIYPNLGQQNAEDLLFTVAGGPKTQFILNYMNSANFSDVSMMYSSSQTFISQIYQKINASLPANGLPTDPDSYIQQQWANATQTPQFGQNWNGMLAGVSNSGPTEISAQSAKYLFNKNNTYSFLNSNGINTWISAHFQDSNSTETLVSNTGLSTQQVSMVIAWMLNSFSVEVTQPNILQQCGITDTSLLGFCQLVCGYPLSNQSLSTLTYVGQPFTLGVVEISVGSYPFGNIPLSQILTNVYSGPLSLSSLQGVSEILQQYSGSQNFTAWNLTMDQATTLLGYISQLSSYTNVEIENIFSQMKSGVIVTRSVDQWLWNCDDALLDYLFIQNPCGLQQNGTIFPMNTILTGRNDSRLTNQYIAFQDHTTYWDGQVKVSGVTESGQFAPNQPIQESLTIFEENTYRPIQIDYTYDSSVQSIPTKRYYLQNNSFPISTTYQNTIPGFANLTTFNNGLPIYLSLWDMYEVPASNSTDNIIGMTPSYENSSIPLDLEPNSGNALYYNLKLQMNILLPQLYSGWNDGGFYKNFKGYNVFYPIFKVGQTAFPSSSTISTLKTQLKELRILKLAPIIIAAVVGGLLMLGGAIMLFFGIRKMKSHRGYTIIQ